MFKTLDDAWFWCLNLALDFDAWSNFWWLLMTFDDSWWLLITLDDSWLGIFDSWGTGVTHKQTRRISGWGIYWGKVESQKFWKKAWKPVIPIGLLLLLPKKSLGWVKNFTFWVIQKNMNFDRKWVENVWYSRAFISSTKV